MPFHREQRAEHRRHRRIEAQRVGALVGIAGGFEGVEGFVLRGTDTGDLLLAVGPVVVDTGRITLPHNVVFLFLCHRIEVQRYKLFLIYGFLFVSLHFKRILKTVYNEENHFYATCAVRFFVNCNNKIGYIFIFNFPACI